MQILIKTFQELEDAKRWDIDFHLPASLIEDFIPNYVVQINEVADIIQRDTRNPKDKPDEEFEYIDIGSLDITEGTITEAKVTLGAEAPSRARKVVKAFDIIVSTVRPTRGAVAVVPVELHDAIASTGYSIVRAHEEINPYYLHFALRLASTREQFRKWSTGSSYPAILDEDVAKTRIPVPSSEIQDKIAKIIFSASEKRRKEIASANSAWNNKISELTDLLIPEGKNNIKYIEKINQSSMTFTPEVDANQNEIIAWDRIPTIESINKLRKYLKII
jgi:hypothetical protein